jgi:nicotinamide mononucleotide transporter
MNWLELVAAAFGLMAVWFTVVQSILCWPMGLVQVLLYVFVFFKAKLYSDMILHTVYVGVQIVGWYSWRHGGKNRGQLAVSRLATRQALGWAGLGVLGSLLWGTFLARYTDAAAPLADAFIAIFSLIAMWLQTRKKVESWWGWIGVDLLAIGVYLFKTLFITAGLYAIFLLLCLKGLREWRRDLAGG